MKQNNKTCLVCRTKYTYCPNCSQFAYLPKWKNLFHDENCRKVFNAISAYGLDKDIAKVKDALDICDLSNKSTFNASILAKINEIYSIGTSVEPLLKTDETTDVVIETVDEIEETCAETVSVASVEDITTNTNTSYKKKKKFKKNKN